MKNVSKAAMLLVCTLASCQGNKVEWVSTTFDTPWQLENAEASSSEATNLTLVVDPDKTLHVMEGFGTTASELSWSSLSLLTQEQRDEIFRELFAPGVGASFEMVRTPMGASDFALEYYSYDDVDGDFGLEHFSIDRDKNYLLPFLKSAQAQNAGLRFWASPWCPRHGSRSTSITRTHPPSLCCAAWKRGARERALSLMTPVPRGAALSVSVRVP